jgi:hypothetical protein
MYSELLQLNMPDEYPEDRARQFLNAAWSVLPPRPPSDGVLRDEFALAFNGISFRFRACGEYRDRLLQVLQQTTKPTPNQTYGYYRDLLGYFVCGVAIIDSICYACFLIASARKPLDVRFNQPGQVRRAIPSDLGSMLGPHFQGAPLLRELQNLINSGEWRFWLSWRNTVAHRGFPPRTVLVVAENPPLAHHATWSTPALVGEPGELDQHFAELSCWASRLLDAGRALAAHPI